jgi:hypothetical protein
MTGDAIGQARDPSATAQRNLWFGAAFQVALLLPSLVAWVTDSRLVNDVSAWSKPIKFQVSLIVLMLTLWWVLPLLSTAVRASRSIRAAAMATVVASTVDILYFVLQSARGRASHFNRDTVFETIMYPITGIAAVVILAACFVVGMALWRGRGSPSADVANAGLRCGAAWGLMLGAALTLVTAGYMAGGDGHWVGGLRSDAGGLPLVGWSTQGGDLRVPHFFATHLMQALPLLGWLADRTTARRIAPLITAGAIVGTGIVAATFAQALAGRPFLG